MRMPLGWGMIRLSMFLAVLPFAAVAETLPGPLSDTVSDFAEILPQADEAAIRAELQDIRAETGVQVVVVTMDRISDHGGWGKTLEAYATELFNQWGVGDRERDDGIMILVVPGTRDMRIELGAGFSSAYDDLAQEVIDTAMLPRFRARQMVQGIADGVRATRERIVGPYVRGEWVGLGRLVTTVLVGLGALGGLVGVALAGKAAWAAYVRCPKCGQPTLSRDNEVLQHSTRYFSGRGVTHLSCPSCGYREDRPYTIAARGDDDDRGSSSGGSSSGGFGGGSSSGGGASGKW
jgi:uncharacterized protein